MSVVTSMVVRCVRCWHAKACDKPAGASIVSSHDLLTNCMLVTSKPYLLHQLDGGCRLCLA